jgi:hypothetical protein
MKRCGRDDEPYGPLESTWKKVTIEAHSFVGPLVRGLAR